MAKSFLPPGFRFHPTDEELLVHYLKKKVAGKSEPDGIIGEIEIYKFEPTDLPGFAILNSRDPEWFFFNVQDKKYHGSRTNRTTRAGYWKATGKDRKVAVGSCTGMKKTLIYYVGRAPHGERTDWVMHEYRLDAEVERKMNNPKPFVLCRVRRKSGLGPRNGEQYGAPVLEEEVEGENGEASVDEACGLPSPFAESAVETCQEMPNVTTVIGDARKERGENFESFLQDFLAIDEQEQYQAEEVNFVVDGLLGLIDNQSHFALVESTHATAPANTSNSNNLDNFSGLLQPVENELVMLEDILQLAGEIEGLPEHPSGMQENHHNLSFNMQRVGYLELADLDEPCDEPSTMESADFDRLLSELDNGMDFPPTTSSIQDQLQVQQSLPSSHYRENLRGSQHLGDSGLNNELEVPLDSSQSLSDIDSLDSRLSATDGAVSSGFASSSDHEGALVNNPVPSLALNQSHSDGQPEAQLGEVDKYLENSNSLVDSTTLVEHGAVNEGLVHSKRHSVELPDNCSDTPTNPASSPSSPSSFARVILGLLGKVNALPASAAELPTELKRSQISQKESGVRFAAGSKAATSMLTHPGSLSISRSSSNHTAKLNAQQDEKQVATLSELDSQWAVSPSAIWDQQSMQERRVSASALSKCLLSVAALVLLAFCSFRGFCRCTRIALT